MMIVNIYFIPKETIAYNIIFLFAFESYFIVPFSSYCIFEKLVSRELFCIYK